MEKDLESKLSTNILTCSICDMRKNCIIGLYCKPINQYAYMYNEVICYPRKLAKRDTTLEKNYILNSGAKILKGLSPCK